MKALNLATIFVILWWYISSSGKSWMNLESSWRVGRYSSFWFSFFSSLWPRVVLSSLRRLQNTVCHSSEYYSVETVVEGKWPKSSAVTGQKKASVRLHNKSCIFKVLATNTVHSHDDKMTYVHQDTEDTGRIHFHCSQIYFCHTFRTCQFLICL